jgi:hypothetical protein
MALVPFTATRTLMSPTATLNTVPLDQRLKVAYIILKYRLYFLMRCVVLGMAWD